MLAALWPFRCRRQRQILRRRSFVVFMTASVAILVISRRANTALVLHCGRFGGLTELGSALSRCSADEETATLSLRLLLLLLLSIGCAGLTRSTFVRARLVEVQLGARGQQEKVTTRRCQEPLVALVSGSLQCNPFSLQLCARPNAWTTRTGRGGRQPSRQGQRVWCVRSRD